MTGDEHAPADTGGSRPPRPSFTHQQPFVLVLVLFLIALQFACAAVIAYQTSRLLDLGHRIEQLEQDRAQPPERPTEQ